MSRPSNARARPGAGAFIYNGLLPPGTERLQRSRDREEITMLMQGRPGRRAGTAGRLFAGPITMARMLGLILIIVLAPGVVFGLVFVKIQCYPGRTRVVDSPESHGMPSERVDLTGEDGVPLKGWYMPPPKAPAPAVLVLHGHVGNRGEHLAQARFLRDAGFGVLTFDFRQHGESGPALVTFGIHEAEEARTYLRYVLGRKEHAGQKVGLHGFSMGAVTALRTASLCPEVACVVADSAFSSLTSQARWRISQVTPPHLDGYCYVFAMVAYRLASGLSPGLWDVTGWVKRIGPRPIFFIHGDADGNILAEHTTILAAAAQGPKQVWVVAGAGHIESRTKEPAEYARRVTEFFKKNLVE
ncbi:MAG: alpha/beta hydrolase [Candidatus Riflebacteria bacterium]|nr:alpha/beta hydrolase [Candidatus Riflebacteria bacterium]